MQLKYLKKNKIVKVILTILVIGMVLFGLYAYKLHSLAVEGNKIFAYRCTNVNPPLIGYKNSFLLMADYFNDPEGSEDIDVGTAFENYNSGLKAYVEEENKWLEMQSDYMNRWDFKLIEPWYIKQAAQLQWKMYEGYRDDAKYLVATYEEGGMTEEIGENFREARDRRDKYEAMYYDFFDEAVEINDWRKYFASVPIPEECNEENMTIPNTSGSIDWDFEQDTPTELQVPIEPGFTS